MKSTKEIATQTLSSVERESIGDYQHLSDEGKQEIKRAIKAKGCL